MNGYMINGGNLTGLTQIQKEAVFIISNEIIKWKTKKKAMPVI